ncbi:uncharacterized protein LOC119365218 isoform X1 [Triticum dicoccoides]|uniref:uncharacterized protein LOC119365218 isoform X1 n=1 Tax=Triticum dicoccoides TaxID=85692 RepID=UPI00188EBEBE|nr:uncharacterized protein LOC119365218 isoform X1 [Triticum dicoccoides]XP_037486724.1 uncharacterized protein LOC119365218 isoform X1 [Triticum dicoccoides]XP_037486725.1 uncharacterized protein LOC119365218 isoform X1 [Triticum dicoccoides]XP_037486726.1 uncharacterized protein LOC119365218 isoform X1 [Triticum dicoccoides]
MKNGEKIADFVPNDGCLNFVEQTDEVLIAEFGLKRHVVGNIPCGRFKVVMVSGVSQRDLFLLLTVTIKNKFMFPSKKLAGPSKKKNSSSKKRSPPWSQGNKEGKKQIGNNQTKHQGKWIEQSDEASISRRSMVCKETNHLEVVLSATACSIMEKGT